MMEDLRFVVVAVEDDHAHSRLAAALREVPGVEGVDLHQEVREVWVHGQGTDVDAIRRAIESAGFELDDDYPQAVRRVTPDPGLP